MQQTNSDFFVQPPPPPPTEMSLQRSELCTENAEIRAVQLVNSLVFLIPYGS